MTLTGWTDAAVAIIISSSIKGSINALEVQGNEIYTLFNNKLMLIVNVLEFII